MQVQSFRKVNGYAFASTMCIGNLRSGMDSLCAWLVGGSTKAFGKAMHYFAIIFLFALGAGLGSLALAPHGQPGHLAVLPAALHQLLPDVPERGHRGAGRI